MATFSLLKSFGSYVNGSSSSLVVKLKLKIVPFLLLTWYFCWLLDLLLTWYIGVFEYYNEIFKYLLNYKNHKKVGR